MFSAYDSNGLIIPLVVQYTEVYFRTRTGDTDIVEWMLPMSQQDNAPVHSQPISDQNLITPRQNQNENVTCL